jgi:DNA repair protein RecO (recombination protein O)
MQHRTFSCDTLILRRSDVGEADRVLVLCTPIGKKRVIAKGVRKTSSRLAGHIELFTYAHMLLATGRNLDVVTQSQVVNPFPLLRADLAHLSCAYYVAELYDALTQDEDAGDHLFSLLIKTFTLLDTLPNVDLVVRAYELHLLNDTGYRPQLFHCALCQELLTEQANRFSPTLGGVLCPDHAHVDRLALPMSLDAFKVLRYVLRKPFNIVERLNISTNVCTEVELLLRSYLQNILERNLKTVAFIDSLRVPATNR